MKERPILMSPEMVRAILEGCKTQTRRTVKPCGKVARVELDWTTANLRQWMTPRGRETRLHVEVRSQRATDAVFASPFGVPGDRLWVKEAHQLTTDARGTGVIVYRADDSARFLLAEDNGEGDIIGTGGKADRSRCNPVDCWRPSIHMPRWASRLTLEVTNVRVQRLQDITESDAAAEGLVCWKSAAFGVPHWGLSNADAWERTARDAFKRVWNKINGDGSWDANPWVWAVAFKVVQPASVGVTPRG